MVSPKFVENAPVTSATTVQRLFVAWQHPETRTIAPVAVVERLPDGTHRFGYLRRARSVVGFRPFVAFPDLGRTYTSDRLFPFFENRLMPRSREDYGSYVESLGLAPDADPFEVLGRSEGRRATDAIEVFPAPVQDVERGEIRCRFLVRGIRHIPGANEAIDELHVCDRLGLSSEPDNLANPRAQLVLTEHGRRLGYLPDYLVDDISRAIDAGGDEAVEVHVEHIGPSNGPQHFRLLCNLRARWPFARPPFSGPDLQPLTAG